jgi:hypothetical protein
VRPKSVLTTAAIALAVVVAYNHVQANGVPKPVLSQPLFRLVADSKVGAAFPALRDLNAYSTHKNG